MTTKHIVQLGFCEPIESEEQRRRVSHHSVAWWSDWDGGHVGGRPSWLNPEELPTAAAVHCTVCPNNQAMQFVCQLYAPLDDDHDDDDDFEPCDDPNVASTSAVNDAFHRSLYVFACPHMTTHTDPTTTSLRVLRTQLPRDNVFWPLDENEKDNDDSNHNAAKTTTSTTWTRHGPERYHKNGLCVVCGFPATGQCPLQQQSFCGTAHQRLYKKQQQQQQQQPTGANSSGDDNDEQSNGNSNLPGIYNMLELVVEEEPPAPSIVELNEKDGRSLKNSAPLYPTIDDSDSDEDIDQDDLNRIVTGKDSNSKKTREDDATYQRFVERWTERPDCKGQVLRYCRWPTQHADASDQEEDVESNGPLWIRSDHQPDQIPACPYCGAERKFEFQLMPQMLHYLTNTVGAKSNCGSNDSKPPPAHDYESVKAAVRMADSLVQQAPPEQIPPALMEAKTAAVARLRNQLLHHGTKASLDWGVVAVYTCTRSCSTTLGNDNESQAKEATKHLGAYREEFTWRQPAIDDDNI